MSGRSGFVARSLFVTLLVGSLVACTFEQEGMDEEEQGASHFEIGKGASDDPDDDGTLSDHDGGPYDHDGGPYDHDGGPYGHDGGPYGHDGGPYGHDGGPFHDGGTKGDAGGGW